MNGTIEITQIEAERIAAARSGAAVRHSEDRGDHFAVTLIGGGLVSVPKLFPNALEEDLAEPPPAELERGVIRATEIIGDEPGRPAELELERIDKRRRIIDLGVPCNGFLMLGSDKPVQPRGFEKFIVQPQLPFRVHRFVPFRGNGLCVRCFGVGTCVLGEIGWSDIAADAEFWSALVFDLPSEGQPEPSVYPRHGALSLPPRFRPWLAVPGINVWCDVENPTDEPQPFAAIVYGRTVEHD